MPRKKVWMNDAARVAAHRAMKRYREIEHIEGDAVVSLEQSHLLLTIKAARGEVKALAVVGKTPEETGRNLINYIKEFRDLP